MFRKPKRTAKGNFRLSTTTTTTSDNKSVHQDDDDNDNTKNEDENDLIGFDQRRKSQHNSDSDDDDDNDTNLNNSNRLQDARKRTKTNSVTTKAVVNSSTSNNTTGNISDVVNSYSTTTATAIDDGTMAMKQKDLVTSTADYHPESILNNVSSTNTGTTTTTGTVPNQLVGIGEDGIFRNQVRNKFLAGPIRTAGNIRVTARFDYQPDICKDYKETGFCGYGDTCIYLHDRSDTLSGWQLEQQWQQQQDIKRKQQETEMYEFATKHDTSLTTGSSKFNDDTDDITDINTKALHIEDDGIPFACYLCRSYFNNPVVTKCGHYFCESCIINNLRISGSDNCPICSVDTGSVFNEPTKLISKIKKVIGLAKSKQHDAWQLYFNTSSSSSNNNNK